MAIIWKALSVVVFPACAGVIPNKKTKMRNNAGIPRMRGGDPLLCAAEYGFRRYSPHARG